MSLTAFPYRRMVVTGVTSAGKSTLAENLSSRLGLDFIELDALHWEPNWVEAPDPVFRQRVEAATSTPGWAVAGNYSVVRDIVWPRAEAVIWLDYPFLTVFQRLLRRTFLRWWRHELLWGTNYENIWNHFRVWSDDSLVGWLFRTYARRKRETPLVLTKPEHAHLKLFHFKTPQATQAWFESLPVIKETAR